MMKNLGNGILDRKLIFITGTARSGTSLVTKVLDAHSKVAILMENIFWNRRRYWRKANFWNNENEFASKVKKVYARLDESVVGNKVGSPDVWSADDIHKFCQLFKNFKIIFVIRNPIAVALSRLERESDDHFNARAYENFLLDFRNDFTAWMSLWRQSINIFWQFQDRYPDRTYLIYYEDFCENFRDQAEEICNFLELPFPDNLLRWHHLSHHDRNGALKDDLKYEDRPVKKVERNKDIPNQLTEALGKIQMYWELWENREIETANSLREGS